MPAGKPVKATRYPEVAQNGIKRITVKRPAELPYLLMAYKVPVLKTAIDHPEQVPEWEPYALEVLASVLDGSSSARVTRHLVSGKAAVREEIEALKNSLVSKNELARIKAQVVSNDVFERDSVFYQAMIIGMFETVGLSWKESEKYVESIKAVTAEQVQAVARKYLQDDRLTVAVLDPQPLDKASRRASPGGAGHGR